MTLRSRGSAPLSTRHCQQGSRLTSGTRCSSARHFLDSQMKITSTPRWLLLLCPARLKPLKIPSLHSNLKCTQVSRWKIKAPSVPSTTSPCKVQVSPSLNPEKKREEQESSIPVGVHLATTEGKKKDLHYSTANAPSYHPAIRSESQVKPSSARLSLDRQLDNSTQALRTSEWEHNWKRGTAKGKKSHKKN